MRVLCESRARAAVRAHQLACTLKAVMPNRAVAPGSVREDFAVRRIVTALFSFLCTRTVNGLAAFALDVAFVVTERFLADIAGAGRAGRGKGGDRHSYAASGKIGGWTAASSLSRSLSFAAHAYE